VYGNELMNGYAGSGPQPLSLLTVLAIADLGYSVNTSAAETWGTYLFATPSFSLGRLPQMLGTPATVIGERLVSPQFATDRAGRRHQIGPAERQ
jgi:hypothetical protein